MKRQKIYKKLTKEEEQELRLKLIETPLEKNDFLAMVIAGIITIMPFVLLIIGIIVLPLCALFIW